MVLFVLDSFANRNTWNFPFFRQVPFYSRIQTKGQKAGPHFSTPKRLTAGFSDANSAGFYDMILYWGKRDLGQGKKIDYMIVE